MNVPLITHTKGCLTTGPVPWIGFFLFLVLGAIGGPVGMAVGVAVFFILAYVLQTKLPDKPVLVNLEDTIEINSLPSRESKRFRKP